MNTKRPAAFAIPGDATQKTGGYIYEWELLRALRRNGRPVEHIELGAGFPDPTSAETEAAIGAMAALPEDTPLIIDGLVFGSIDTAGLAKVKAPIIAMIHHPLGLETGLSPDRSAYLLQREANNLALAQAVLVPSPHTARILIDQFGVAPDKITIALPGFRPADPIKTPLSPPLILSVGLLAERKGHDVLVAALGQIRDLDWRAQIVGKTHDPLVATRLHNQIAELDLSDRIIMTGLLDDADVISRYRQATIFALATRYEGYGIVLGEALLHGLPIVTCRTGAVPDTVPEGAGILVPVNDAKAFANALRRLLSNEELRQTLATRSREAGKALPSWDDTCAVVDEILCGNSRDR